MAYFARGSYAQGSSQQPAPEADDAFLVEHLDLASVIVTPNFSAPYADGGTAVWGTLLTLDNTILKLDHATFAVIDSYSPRFEEADPPEQAFALSGAYSLVDRHNQFIVGRQRAVEVYGDAVDGDRFSAIALRKRLFLPDSFFCDQTDSVVAINMTYDGHLVLVTARGAVGMLPAEVEAMTADALQHLQLNEAACDGPMAHLISNNIAVDEAGGIFVVTSLGMVRLQWDGQRLTKSWEVAYETGGEPLSALRLGPGSGSTPSLMGHGEADKFVVITDGQPLMHLVLIWRDEIPADWQPIGPGKDRRIACEIPVRFGDPNAERSLSEQSVLVSGKSAVLVNNLLQDEPALWRRLPEAAGGFLAVQAGGNPDRAPFGVERIDWNPDMRQCQSVWANPEISIPNGIPTMSRDSGLVYGIGQRDGVWGVEALDFETGASAFFVESRQTSCSPAAIQQVRSRGLRFTAVLPTMLLTPASCENSVFAATEIGPDGSIYSGTFLGISKFSIANRADEKD